MKKTNLLVITMLSMSLMFAGSAFAQSASTTANCCGKAKCANKAVCPKAKAKGAKKGFKKAECKQFSEDTLKVKKADTKK